MRDRVVILGSPGFVDTSAVRIYVKRLPSGSVVLIDDDPFDVQLSAMRECRCAGLVCVVHRLPANGGRNAVAARKERDAVLLEGATKVVVFGQLAADRELTLRELPTSVVVERRGTS